MSQETSPSIRRHYGLKRTCQVWQVPRPTVYEHRKRSVSQESKRRPGPEPTISDSEVLTLVRKDLECSPFHGEGHRKVHARLRRQEGITVGRERVRKVMRNKGLLSPYRSPIGVKKVHDGRITTDEPNIMWGTDAAKIFTSEDGWVWFFGRFRKSGMYPTLRHINRKLNLWAMRKFKKKKGHRRRAEHWLGRIAKQQPGLFPHWKLGVLPMVG